jgi:hypothetical protein
LKLHASSRAKNPCAPRGPLYLSSGRPTDATPPFRTRMPQHARATLFAHRTARSNANHARHHAGGPLGASTTLVPRVAPDRRLAGQEPRNSPRPPSTPRGAPPLGTVTGRPGAQPERPDRPHRPRATAPSTGPRGRSERRRSRRLSPRGGPRRTAPVPAGSERRRSRRLSPRPARRRPVRTALAPQPAMRRLRLGSSARTRTLLAAPTNAGTHGQRPPSAQRSATLATPGEPSPPTATYTANEVCPRALLAADAQSGARASRLGARPTTTVTGALPRASPFAVLRRALPSRTGETPPRGRLPRCTAEAATQKGIRPAQVTRSISRCLPLETLPRRSHHGGCRPLTSRGTRSPDGPQEVANVNTQRSRTGRDPPLWMTAADPRTPQARVSAAEA